MVHRKEEFMNFVYAESEYYWGNHIGDANIKKAFIDGALKASRYYEGRIEDLLKELQKYKEVNTDTVFGPAVLR